MYNVSAVTRLKKTYRLEEKSLQNTFNKGFVSKTNKEL